MSEKTGAHDQPDMLNTLPKPTPTAGQLTETGDIRVFNEPTLAGLAIAAGGHLASVREDGGRLLFYVSDAPEEFEAQHRSGDLCVPTKEAEFWVKHCVGLIRSQVRLRERTLEVQAKKNRDELARMPAKSSAK